MDIKTLDEYQGLTAEMVRAYLRRKEWTLRNMGVYREWDSPGCAGPCSYHIYDASTSLHPKGDGGCPMMVPEAVGVIAHFEQRTIQALLRDINPRLRKGVPSMEARREHRLWLCVCGPGSISVLKVDDYPDEGSLYRVGGMGRCVLAACELCEFWPCDAAGNKVRWPERDGVML